MVELFFRVAMALGVIAVGLLAGYAAGSFGWTDVRAWYGFLTSSGWPAAAGRITHAAIVPIRSSRATRYQPEVHYTYTVAGQTYTGERRAFTSWTEWLTQAEAEAALRPYPLGAAVDVFYDPRRPQNAVLIRRAPGGLIASGGIVLLLAGTSLFCLAVGLIGLFQGP